MLLKILMLTYLCVDVNQLTKTQVENLDLTFENCKKLFDNNYISCHEFDQKLKYFANKINILNTKKIKYMTIFDEEYPMYLKNEGILFFTYKGNIKLLKRKLVGFVGTRECSENAYNNSNYYAGFLAKKDYVIVSGLAIGIDSSATKGSLLNGGKCIEVLPSSLDKVTPKRNEKLLDEVLLNGGLAISTNLPGSRIYKSNYHNRNKLIALLSNSIIVGETKTSGGTISTIKYAYENGKTIYLLNYPQKITLFSPPKIELYKKKYNAREITTLIP